MVFRRVYVARVSGTHPVVLQGQRQHMIARQLRLLVILVIARCLDED